MFAGGDQATSMAPYPAISGDRRWKPRVEVAPSCPRCDSPNTKFCYYNNYSLTQPRYFCKGCRRYWTKGGSLRNVPVGGGCRKNRRGKPQPQARISSPPSVQTDRSSSSYVLRSECANEPSSSIDLGELYAKFITQSLEEVDTEFGLIPELNENDGITTTSTTNYEHMMMMGGGSEMHEYDFSYNGTLGVGMDMEPEPLVCPMEGVTGDNFSSTSMLFNGGDAAHQYGFASGDWSSVLDQSSLNALYF